MLTMLASAIVALPALAEPPPLTRIEDSYPSLSPDGKHLLFQSTRGGRWALYLADPDGNNVRILLDSGDDPTGAAWSPDGRQIAYSATVEGQPEVFVMDADGKRRKRLTYDLGDDSHPHWSADGSRIFFYPGVVHRRRHQRLRQPHLLAARQLVDIQPSRSRTPGRPGCHSTSFSIRVS